MTCWRRILPPITARTRARSGGGFARVSPLSITVNTGGYPATGARICSFFTFNSILCATGPLRLTGEPRLSTDQGVFDYELIVYVENRPRKAGRVIRSRRPRSWS